MQKTPLEQLFPRQRRLVKAIQYRHVFSKARRYKSHAFTILIRKQADNDSVETARLGLAIAKRQVKRAIDRNRVKRLVRESFRQSVDHLPPVDIVVMCRFVVTTMDNQEIFTQLNRLWMSIASSTRT